MIYTEIAELASNISMYDLACKTIDKAELTENEGIAVAQLDEWAREIGKTGYDKDHEIAAFITRAVNDELYESPDELLDLMFDRGSIGEDDDGVTYLTPKNTLIAYEAAKGGNVDRSYIDVTVLTPTFRNRQVETAISYKDLRNSGWKSVATLTEYAVAQLKAQMFVDVVSAVDAVITSGSDNYITEATANPTATSMDKLAVYLLDRAAVGASVIIARSAYIQAASKLAGFASDNMKDAVNRSGFLGEYAGCKLKPVSSAIKLGNGTIVMPDDRVFGIAGKIGTLDMKGEVHVYETADNNSEQIHIKIADFTYGYAMNATSAEKMAKIVLA